MSIDGKVKGGEEMDLKMWSNDWDDVDDNDDYMAQLRAEIK